MKNHLPQFSILFLLLFLSISSFCQVKLGDNVTSIDARSILELESTTKALYLPRLTTSQRNSQTGWKAGMFIYNSTLTCVQFFDGVNWECLAATPMSLDLDIDSTNELIDSISIVADSLFIHEAGQSFSAYIPTLDSVNQSISVMTYVNDTLSITEGDTTFKVELNVYGTHFNLFENATQTTNDNTTLETKISGTTSVLPVGKYEITVGYLWRHDDNGQDFISEFTFDNASVTSTAGNVIHRQEPKDEGTNQTFVYQKSFYVDVVTAGAKSVLLQYRPSQNNDDAVIWNASVKVIRVQ